ncbi:hypothetical protein [Siphonobacter sp. SORGH_AS_1065]|uniref:hypothetical protein n=1 Tax=Siphonobacter sp. SORGH_AS_1065 TaxID=3041795 RepID=UPI0027874866|nr:hypothetical protein [Siphonobacter sp. SORGH_AS_1065]MDQ1088583.1 hypothetical protein [Siphonobacter sp. SORGH_AS_1065]
MKPTESQIQKTIDLIDDKLDDPKAELASNLAVKEGYVEALDILVNDRQTYEGIDALTTVQSRAIAVLAVDYLLGDCEQKVLVGVNHIL